MENDTPDRPLAGGKRVFTCGHSFHFWVADLLVDLGNGVGIQDHRTIGTSAIGGSRVIQHWDVPEEQNEAKKALQEGNVDVLTLSCMTRPDEGIRKFAGTVPGVEKQSDLFTDAWGHPSSTLRMLSAYCHFFVIYRRSAVGLPSPGALSGEPGGDDALNRILQQLAWDAVTQHPLSGDCDGTVQSSG